MDPVRPAPSKRKASDDGGAGPSGFGGAGAEPSPDLSKVRAYAACKACRAKKVKCHPGPAVPDAERGSVPGRCVQCAAAGLECVYPPTRDRAAYSRQYVQNLEARVQLLEHAQARIAPLVAAFEAGALAAAPGPGPPPLVLSAGGPGPAADGMDAASYGDDDEVEAGVSGEDAEAERDDHEGRMTRDERGNYRWLGASNALSLLDSFGPSTAPAATDGERDGAAADGRAAGGAGRFPDGADEQNPYFGPVAGAGIVKALPNVGEVTYPPRDYAESLVEAFLSDVHPVLPVVLEHEFRAVFRQIMDNVDRGEREQSSAGCLSVVFAVFALGERVLVGSRAWQRERRRAPTDEVGETVLPGEAEAGVIWFERAQVLHWTDKQVSIEQVQCLTLLAAFQASVNAMPMSWILAGQAIRIAQDIGLHMGFAQRQLGGRCWWAIYGLERMISITLGRPLAIDDLDIDVPYPAIIDDATLARMDPATPMADVPDEPADSVMSGFVALTKLCRIAGRVAQLLFRPSHGKSVNDLDWASSLQSTIDKLDKLLRQWLETEVPSKYKNHSGHNHPLSRMSAVLSSSYFAVLITLHRNLLPSNPDYPRPTPLTSTSLPHCVDAARSVIHIAAISDVLLPPSHHLAVHAQFLWSSAVILLLCELRAKDQVVVDTVARDVDSCRRSLSNLEPVWPGARKLKQLLGDVEQRARHVRASAAAAAARPPLPKKRKSSHEPAAGRRSGSGAGSGPSSARPSPRALAARDPAARFETSDARTAGQAAGAAPPPPPPRSAPPPSSAASAFPSLPSTPLRVPSQAPAASAAAYAPALDAPDYELFDVSGMTFEGLEMLQAFTGDLWGGAPAQAGGSVFPAGLYPAGTGQAGSPAPYTPGPGTPAGLAPLPMPGTVDGTVFDARRAYQAAAPPPVGLPPPPDPHAHTNPPPHAHTNPHTNPHAHPHSLPASPPDGLWWTAPGPDGRAVPDIGELWSQVAGAAGFDWQADPSVPFNV